MSNTEMKLSAELIDGIGVETLTKNVSPAAAKLQNGTRDWPVALAAIALVTLAPLGHEGTHPLIFLTFSSLLFGLAGFGAITAFREKSTLGGELCPWFAGWAALTVVFMFLSFGFQAGSHFD